MLYEDQYPKHLGPPTVVNHTGRKLLNATKPLYPVELDAGAFRAVWELLEGEARHRFPTHEALSGTRALLRAVEAFRQTYWSLNEPPAPPEPPALAKSRRLTRKRA